jgi:hypothetical protein
MYLSKQKSHRGGKCVTCCGLHFSKIADVGITGPSPSIQQYNLRPKKCGCGTIAFFGDSPY